jgi:hypothetical protein
LGDFFTKASGHPVGMVPAAPTFLACQAWSPFSSHFFFWEFRWMLLRFFGEIFDEKIV